MLQELALGLWYLLKEFQEGIKQLKLLGQLKIVMIDMGKELSGKLALGERLIIVLGEIIRVVDI